MKPTPAEQHIAEQSRRRDPISLDFRITKLEERLHSHEVAMRLDRRRFNLMGPGPSVQDIVKQEIDGPVRSLSGDIEALKESLEGAWERIQALILRVDAKMLREVGIPQDLIDKLMREPGKAEPFPGPAKPFDFGAELRIDWDIVSGKREPDDSQWKADEIAGFKKQYRIASAYWALSERLQRLHAGNLKAYEDQLAELFDALGHPQHPETPKPGIDPQAELNRRRSAQVAIVVRHSQSLRIELLRQALRHAHHLVSEGRHMGGVLDSIDAALKGDADMERDYGHED